MFGCKIIAMLHVSNFFLLIILNRKIMKIKLEQVKKLRKDVIINSGKTIKKGTSIFVVDAFTEKGNPFIAFHTNFSDNGNKIIAKAPIHELGFKSKKEIKIESDLIWFIDSIVE